MAKQTAAQKFEAAGLQAAIALAMVTDGAGIWRPTLTGIAADAFDAAMIEAGFAKRAFRGVRR